MSIPVVDIFAGPGGLGEGFSAFARMDGSRAFRIAVSAEKDLHAWKTLRLRAFFRQFEKGAVPDTYYAYVRGEADRPFSDLTEAEWRAAQAEARQLTLGEPDHDAVIDRLVAQVADRDVPWVLIGGPPCQAYSLVGRARNRGIRGYTAEGDDRHFLYEHYLRLLGKYRPAAFIMENVKGILSASVSGERLFHRILEDLHRPGRGAPRYRILPLLNPGASDLFPVLKPNDFIVRAERLGVPQARHRVILLGVREDLGAHIASGLADGARANLGDVISTLPVLRSGTTSPGPTNWGSRAARIFRAAASKVGRSDPEVAQRLRHLSIAAVDKPDPGCGAAWLPTRKVATPQLWHWYGDARLRGILNHEARSHMDEDLQRYAFAAAFAELHGRSPRAEDFPAGLAPEHRNWDSGKFVDRFKVQRADAPSSTITSHLAKDGHYFIHPDATQVRSLTVREAARLQTFPDNYFFEGTRGKQFQQVGNAVPPWLAYQIARVVHDVLDSAREPRRHSSRRE